MIIFTRTHPGRALGNVTNGAKPPQQQQVRPRAILGDISNRAAAPALSAGAKKEELPPVECLHVSDPAPPASFESVGALLTAAQCARLVAHTERLASELPPAQRAAPDAKHDVTAEELAQLVGPGVLASLSAALFSSR